MPSAHSDGSSRVVRVPDFARRQQSARILEALARREAELAARDARDDRWALLYVLSLACVIAGGVVTYLMGMWG